MGLHLAPMPDDPDVAAIMYGPIVLAGALGTEAMTPEMQTGLGWPDVDRMNSNGAAIEIPCLVASGRPLEEWIKPVAGKSLTFRTFNVGRPADVTLVPFYRLFGQRYAIYWNIISEGQWTTYRASRTALQPGVVDIVSPGDSVSDRAHNFQAYRFQAGEEHGRKFVMSHLWFRYDVNVDPDHPMELRCTYSGEDRDRSFEILIDGLPMATQQLVGGKPGEFLDTRYPIPSELLKGKKRVAVMFRGKDGKSTGELFGCEVAKSEQ
jgi:hypothetical protein